MSWNVNVVNKGDVIVINGVRFCARYDFNIAEGHKNLLLKRIGDVPNEYVAIVEKKN